MVIFGLGSNMEDRLAMLGAAVARLGTFIGNMTHSSIYECRALLPEDAPPEWDCSYLNMAVAGECGLPAREILKRIKQVEADLGRTPRRRWAPREIDIDILAMDKQVIEEDDLWVPHRELLSRDFALVPLAELAPDWRYPRAGEYHGRTAAEIVAAKQYSLKHDATKKHDRN